MRVICAWCGKEIGKYDGDSADVSHGICDECLSRVEKEFGLEGLAGMNKAKRGK